MKTPLVFLTIALVSSVTFADDLSCLKAAQGYAKSTASVMLGGADKVKEITWLGGGAPVLDNGKQDQSKLHYEIAVTSTSFKSQGKYDMFDYDFVITLKNKTCVPTTMRLYDLRSTKYEDIDTLRE
jgi:hypothetical protein